MSRITSLDNILRKHEVGETVITGGNELMILYDPKRKVIVDKPTLLNRGRLLSYVLTIDKTVRYVAAPLKLQGNGIPDFPVTVICHFGCARSQARKVVHALAGVNDPATTLDQCLLKASNAFQDQEVISRGRDPVLDFFDLRELWQKHLEDTIEKQVGFKTEVQLEVGGELDTIEFVDEIGIYVNDFDDELSLAIRLDLEVIEDSKKEAIVNLTERKKLFESIVKTSRTWVRDHLGIQAFCTGFDENTKLALRDVINKAIRKFGRESGHLVLQPRVPFSLPDLTGLIHHETECRPKGVDTGAKVQLKHVFAMEIDDISSFLRGKVDDLRTWACLRLDEISETKTLSLDLSDFVNDFESSVRDPIWLEFSRVASGIGIAVGPHSSEPDFPFDVLPDEQLTEQLTAFTKDCDEPVTISVRTTLTIPHHRKVDAIGSFKRNDNLNDWIVKSIRGAVADSYSINEFSTGQDRIVEEIKCVIQGAADLYGREARQTQIEIQLPFALPPLESVETTSDFEMQSGSSRLKVQLSFLIEIQDVAKFRLAKIDRPMVWATDELVRIAQDIFIELDYQEAVNRFDQPRSDLKSRFTERLTGCGIRLRKFNAGLAVDSDVVAPEVIERSITVHVSDCDDAMSVQLEGRFSVNDSKQALLGAAGQEDFENSIVETVRTVAAASTAHQFCCEPEAIVAKIKQSIEPIVDDFGRKIDFCKAVLSYPFELPKLGDFSITNSCIIKDWNRPVDVRHDVLLQLQDIAKYRQNLVSDIEGWIREELESITKPALFNRDYIDLVSHFDGEIQNEIRAAMTKAAQRRGLELKQFSSVPNIEVNLLQKVGFNIDIPDHAFRTQDSREPVQLQLIVRGKVTNLEPIKKRLTSEGNLTEEIRTVLITACEDVLHDTTPKDFYIHFDSPPPMDLDSVPFGSSPVDLNEGFADDTDGGLSESWLAGSAQDDLAIDVKVTSKSGTARHPSHGSGDSVRRDAMLTTNHTSQQAVRKRIVDAITDELRSEFGAECSRITIKQTDTLLSTRLTGLCSARPVIKCEVRPVDGPAVTFEIAYRVVTVAADFWHVYLNNRYLKNGVPDVDREIDDLSVFIHNWISQHLDHTLPLKLLLFETSKLRERLEQAIWIGIHIAKKSNDSDPSPQETGVRRKVVERYGLVIALDSFKRKAAGFEDLRREQTDKAIRQQIESEDAKILGTNATIKELEKLIHEKVIVDVDDWELPSIRAEIKRLRASIKKPKEFQEVVQARLPDTRNHERQTDHLEEFLLGGEAQSRIEDKTESDDDRNE